MLSKAFFAAVGFLVIGFTAGYLFHQRVAQSSPTGSPPPLTFRATKVIDGDTFEIETGEVVRLLALDAPDRPNPTYKTESLECYAREAFEFLESLIINKELRLEEDRIPKDLFGRLLRYAWVDDQHGNEIFVNHELVENGMARYFYSPENTKYQGGLIQAAKEAHSERQGLWDKCGGKEGCLIKGNLDKQDKRWYHLPSSRYYQLVTVNLDHGDRWFCSEEEAIGAGFVRARREDQPGSTPTNKTTN